MDVFCCVKTKRQDHQNDDSAGIIQTIFQRFYTPFIMKTPVRVIVLIVFFVVLIVQAVVVPNIGIGLEQKLSMPADSYVLKYFQVTCLSCTKPAFSFSVHNASECETTIIFSI